MILTAHWLVVVLLIPILVVMFLAIQRICFYVPANAFYDATRVHYTEVYAVNRRRCSGEASTMPSQTAFVSSRRISQQDKLKEIETSTWRKEKH